MAKRTYLEASGAVSAIPATFVAAQITAAGDAATLIVYDAASAAGDPICVLAAAAGTTASFTPARGIECATGIYAATTGTGEKAVVLYG